MRRVASSALVPGRPLSLASSQSFSQLMSGVSAARLSRDDPCSQMYLAIFLFQLTDFKVNTVSSL